MFESAQIHTFLADLDAYQLSWNNVDSVKKTTKIDSSPVTEIDHGLSNFFKNHTLARDFCFFSEEEYSELNFPALILDPLDGTKEFILGRSECAISAAWMSSPKLHSKHFALIKNPFTGFMINSFNRPNWSTKNQKAPFYGLVSRSEWEEGLFNNFQSEQFSFTPRGSIAFKLALLASGGCDFVISLRPKNLWDIAAGTLLNHQRGLEFWSNGKKMTELSQATYVAPLIWAPPKMISDLTSILSP